MYAYFNPKQLFIQQFRYQIHRYIQFGITTLSPIKTSLYFLETPANSSISITPPETIDTTIDPNTNEPNPYQEITDWFARKVLNYRDGSLHGIASFSSS